MRTLYTKDFYGLAFFIPFALASVFFSSSLSAQPSKNINGLDIKRWDDEMGSRVYFVKTNRLPIIDVAIDIDAGSRWDPVGKEGLASMVSNMLFKGHKDKKLIIGEEKVGEFFAENSIIRSVSTSRDKVTITLRFLNEPEVIERVIKFISDVFKGPLVNNSILERQKDLKIIGLREALTRPQQIALRELWKRMYPEHPYGRSPTEESLKNLDRVNLLEFFETFWTPPRMTFSIVGDVSKKTVKKFVSTISQARTMIGKTKTQPSGYNTILPPVIYPLGKTAEIEHPAEQSHIWIGLPLMARHQTEDVFPFFVANHILGGSGFGSRLTLEVREKRGLSYSVFSGFSLLKQKGPFFIGLQTGKEKREEALGIVRTTLEDFVKNGPTSEELESAKTGLIGGFALKLDSNRKTLLNLSQIAFYNLPLDYLDEWVDNMTAVTREDVMRVLRTYFSMENLSTVVIGK